MRNLRIEITSWPLRKSQHQFPAAGQTIPIFSARNPEINLEWATVRWHWNPRNWGIRRKMPRAKWEISAKSVIPENNTNSGDKHRFPTHFLYNLMFQSFHIWQRAVLQGILPNGRSNYCCPLAPPPPPPPQVTFVNLKRLDILDPLPQLWLWAIKASCSDIIRV